MTKPQVLFIGELDQSLPQYIEFGSKYHVIHYNLTSQDQLLLDFQGDLKNIDAIYGSWLGFMLLGGFREEILDKCPLSLKIISICSVGYDGYDGKTMAGKNIVLTNVPSVGAAEPVAELVLYNTLLSFRQFSVFQNSLSIKNNHTINVRKYLETSQWDAANGKVALDSTDGYAFGERVNTRFVNSPRNHNVVILGFGNIGQTIGDKLNNLGMKVGYVKRNPLSQEEQGNLGYDATYYPDLSSVTSFCDLLVVACPATPQTYHLIDEKLINSMENPFRIINIGRGNIVNEEHLVAGLKSGKILFAGLDVFEQEPKIHPELLNRDDVVLTPHIGASTKENFDFTAIQAMKNIDLVLLGKDAVNKVN